MRATLRHLARGKANPTYRVTGETVWLARRTSRGAATLRFAQAADGSIRADAWGPGAEIAISRVPVMCGAGDDWSTLDVSRYPVLAETLRRNPGLRLARTESVLDELVLSIIEQRITGIEAHHAWAQLLIRYGTPAPGPAPRGMFAPPAPEVWRKVPSWEWHRVGVDPGRSATVMRAVAVADSLERTVSFGRGDVEVTKRLRSIPGVGVWTSAETTQRSHGDADAPSFGDYHVPALVGWVLLGKPVDDDGMRELLEPWRGQRQRVMRLIAACGIPKPRFGPRMTVQDHRGH